MKGFTESLRTELLHDESPIEVVMVHLPAVNTPQFDWSRSRMPRRAQPVPPIFQPEVAARAIVLAANEPRREVWVGAPTAKAIVAERLAPGIADRWLARHGLDAQMTDEVAEPGRPDNLFAPLPGDRGAHGRFDTRAKDVSLQAWANAHRGVAVATVLAGVFIVALKASLR
jgi:hypothetical protein